MRWLGLLLFFPARILRVVLALLLWAVLIVGVSALLGLVS